MVKCILDTDILSEYLKGNDPNVIRHAARYAKEHDIFTFTSVTVYEIVYGLELKSASSQLNADSLSYGDMEGFTSVIPSPIAPPSQTA
jgi:predicted nucleic acid-binding protein